MEPILKSLTPHTPLIAALGLVLATVLLVVIVIQAAQLRKVRVRWNQLLTDSSGQSIENLLKQHLDLTDQTRSDISGLAKRIETLEMKMQSAKRYTGMVKFDAFPDVGGQLSFAFALYDEQGNGIVLTSLVGRADCRVYCKDIKGGKAERELTGEEQQALQMAAKRRSEALVGA